jgi:hypothetical protein
MKTFKRYLIEGKKLDSQHVQRGIGLIIDDMKSGPKEERKVIPTLQWLTDRLNQSYPDGDIDAKIVKEILTEPEGRKLVKKSGWSLLDIIDYVMQ